MANDFIAAENSYAPKSNFFLAWKRDGQGRWSYVGFTVDETQELLALQGIRLVGDEIELLDDPDLTREQSARYRELHDRHERARLREFAEAVVRRHGGANVRPS